MSILQKLKNVKYYREKANLTPKELSKRVGQKSDYIERFEADLLKKNPSIRVLLDIADELNIDIRDLFSNEER